ncbi:unnamed protein product [Cylicocyclus nassatus]|uniref:Acyltransferase 3 domain-containing protein n=1 Tax=Cylicocyclus nassatus TaxID=53992 RepID=A0AA36GGQ4_CYLNA|nr:unnamed protein product [Cylicocyclus nassatus]
MAMIITRNKCICMASLSDFYYRRIKRILPLYYMVLLAILLLVILELPTYRTLNLPRSRRALTFTANIEISKKEPLKEYEEMLTNAVDLFTHTWSLCVEIQWYLLVPLLFYVQSLLPFRKITFFSGIALASMEFYFYADNNTAFNSVFARMWQFCAGIIAFSWHHNNTGAFTEAEKSVDYGGSQREENLTFSRLTQIFSWIVFILAVSLPFFGIILPKDFLRVETTILTAVLIVAGKRYQVPVLTRPDIVYVGEISYALYLIHWPVFVVMKYFYPENPLSQLHPYSHNPFISS